MNDVETIEATERLFEATPYERRATATVMEVTERGIVLDRTLFYAESGGQPGDRGHMTLTDGRTLAVTDTRYLPGKLRIGHCIDAADAPPVGSRVTLDLDWERRHRHMRMHTALHLLCGLVDAPVTGCAIHAERGRIDFDLPESPFDRETLDARLQTAIAADHAVTQHWRTGAAVATAMANRRSVAPPPATTHALRVVEIDGVDLQPCGGTHCHSTAELAGLRVAKMQKKSRHNRRVSVVDDTVG